MPAWVQSVFVARRRGWLQLFKFSLVGGSGFVVNLAVYAFAYGVLSLHYLVAAVVAFFVSTVNNYLINRYWTFPGRGKPKLAEYGRFLVIGLAALGGNLVLLAFFVDRLRLAEMPSQAAAIVLVTPVSFLGNKVWTFRPRQGASRGSAGRGAGHREEAIVAERRHQAESRGRRLP